MQNDKAPTHAKINIAKNRKNRQKTRLIWIIILLLALGGGTGLILNAFKNSVVFFYTVKQVSTKNIPENVYFRIGGLVEENSIRKKNTKTYFNITDGELSIAVIYQGIVPSLFREGQVVVAEGNIKNGVIFAKVILAKHDENYMPKEVIDSLKEQGTYNAGTEKYKKRGFKSTTTSSTKKNNNNVK